MTTIPPMPDERRVPAMIEDLKAWGTAGWAERDALKAKLEEVEAEFRRDGLWFSKAEHDALEAKLEEAEREGKNLLNNWRDVVANVALQLRDEEAQAAALAEALEELLNGLDATTWSSWQTTARFSEEQQAAKQILATYREGR